SISFLTLFFSLLRPHPSSTLFPYTTLFRSLAPHVNAAHPELVAAQLQRVVEDLVDRRRDLFGFVLARKRQQVLHDAAGAAGFAVNRLRRRALVGREFLLRQQQLGERRDTGQRVVELVRDAG